MSGKYDKLKNAELRGLLKSRGLPISGNKSVMTARLYASDEKMNTKVQDEKTTEKPNTIKIRDDKATVEIPVSELLTSEFFRNMYESVENFGDEIDVSDFGLDLYSFMKILFYNMSRNKIPLSLKEINALDKFLMNNQLAHFEDRKIISGSDSKKLYSEVKGNYIEFDNLLPNFQEAIVLEAVLAGDFTFFSETLPYFIERIVRDPWMFYPNYNEFYKHIQLNDEMLSPDDLQDLSTNLDTIKEVLKKYIDPTDLISILGTGVEPYVLKYIQNPTLYRRGMDKNFYDGTIANDMGYQSFVLVPVIGNEHYNLAKRLIANGLDINARNNDNENILYQISEYTLDSDVIDRLRNLRFLLEMGFDPVQRKGDQREVFSEISNGIESYSEVYAEGNDEDDELPTDAQVADHFKTTKEYSVIIDILKLLKPRAKLLKDQLEIVVRDDFNIFDQMISNYYLP